jgi:hypothetical protein
MCEAEAFLGFVHAGNVAGGHPPQREMDASEILEQAFACGGLQPDGFGLSSCPRVGLKPSTGESPAT